MCSAMQVGMALADTIENRFGRPKRVAGNDFVFQLYHKWGLGTLECQAGMLVVVEQSMSQVSVARTQLHFGIWELGLSSWSGILGSMWQLTGA